MKKNKADGLTVVIRILIALIIMTVAFLAVNIGYELYLRHTHPIEYSDFVELAAKEHDLDKFLIYAVIKTESGFDPDAVSNVGARGLMQIMPDTFNWINDHRLDEDLTYAAMFNPEDNIRYGAYLISYHMRHYNNVDNSLAAYHAGDGRVDEWLKSKEYSSDGETLHTIPIKDTSHYVNKVNKAYETYIKLYS